MWQETDQRWRRKHENEWSSTLLGVYFQNKISQSLSIAGGGRALTLALTCWSPIPTVLSSSRETLSASRVGALWVCSLAGTWPTGLSCCPLLSLGGHTLWLKNWNEKKMTGCWNRNVTFRLRLASFDNHGKLVCSRSTGYQLLTLEKDQVSRASWLVTVGD